MSGSFLMRKQYGHGDYSFLLWVLLAALAVGVGILGALLYGLYYLAALIWKLW